MIRAFFCIIRFILVTSFAGFNIVAAYDRKNSLSKLETAGLSYLFGIGAISIEIFFFGIFNMKWTTPYIIIPWIIIAVINIPRFRNMIVMRKAATAHKKKGSFFILTAALLIFAIFCAFFTAMLKPVESYDSIAIWSLKAKIIYLARTLPPDFFTMIGTKFHGAHPDYPLLVPLSEVWFYTFINNFNDYLVKAIFPVNMLAFLAVFYVFLKKAGLSREFAVAFTFILASVKHFSDYAINGYADMPMAVYGSLVFLALYLWIKENNTAYFWTAFLSCAFAIWTKNEGAVVLAGFITVLALHIIMQVKERGEALLAYKNVILSSLILVILFALWTFFKISMNIRNDVVNLQTFAKYDPLSIFKRLAAILYEYQRQAFGIKYWNLSWIAFIFFIIIKFRKLFSGDDKYILIPVFFILACYTGIYFITPQDITWHLRTSANRLLLHILPLAVFYIAMQTYRICDGPLRQR